MNDLGMGDNESSNEMGWHKNHPILLDFPMSFVWWLF